MGYGALRRRVARSVRYTGPLAAQGNDLGCLCVWSPVAPDFAVCRLYLPRLLHCVACVKPDRDCVVATQGVAELYNNTIGAV